MTGEADGRNGGPVNDAVARTRRRQRGGETLAEEGDGGGLNSLRDVMAVMTRRFEHLLIEQEKRQAKLFDELFGDDAAVDESMRPDDVLLEYRDSVADCNAPLATEDTLPKEQSTDSMSELQCAPVGLRESARPQEAVRPVRPWPYHFSQN